MKLLPSTPYPSRGQSRALLLSAILFLVVCLPAGVRAQQTVTLDEAINLALARSPSYAQAGVSVDNARETRRTAVGAFLPTLSLSTGASMRPGSVFDPTTQAQISATN